MIKAPKGQEEHDNEQESKKEELESCTIESGDRKCD